MQETSKEYEKVEKWCKGLLGENFDKFDLKAHYDSTLNVDENKAQLKEKMKGFLKADLKEQVEQAKADQERLQDEAIKKAEAEVQLYNSRVKYEVSAELKKIYAPVYRVISKIAAGKCRLAMIEGSTGIGKTYNILNALAEYKMDYVTTGENTEAYLYRTLYENNGKVIYMKEATKLMQKQSSLNLLKAATESEHERILTKCSYSKDQADLPDRFVFRGSIIFDYNAVPNINGLREDMEAFKGRGDHIRLAFCPEELKQILRAVAKTETEKQVTEYVIDQYDKYGMVKLNLRTQKKAFETFEWAEQESKDWKQELEQELKVMTKTRAMLYALIGKKAVRTTELKKLLIKNEYYSSIRVCEYEINKWLLTEDLYRHSEDERNFYVSLVPKER